MALSKEDLDAITGVVKTTVDTRFNALETGIKTRLNKIESTVTKMAEEDDDEEKKKKKEEEDKDKDKTEMSEARINKAVLSAVREIFPKATVDNLTSLAARHEEGKDEYAEKHAAAMALGMTTPQATKFMATKHAALYNTKFGNGGGQKGSASTKL